jgi:hypothetical protein
VCDAVTASVDTWCRVQLVATPVLIVGWAIWIVQSIRGEASFGSRWALALFVGNLVLGLGRLHFDRLERERT